jgi:hypothetical protein
MSVGALIGDNHMRRRDERFATQDHTGHRQEVRWEC